MFLTVSPLDFVRQHSQQLEECCCLPFDRKIPNNARNFIDLYTASHLEKRGWPKHKPIRILDIGSGGLLQIATTMTSLANEGYLVELILVDENISTLVEKDKVQSLSNLFCEINKITKKESVQLVAQFSSVDSYLATIEGVKPLEFEQVSHPAKIKERIAAGTKRRYLVPFWGQHESMNRQFKIEFKRFVNSCKNKHPDLVLIVDDITEFLPYGVTKTDYPKACSFAFNYEIVEPFKKLNPNVTFLGTEKRDNMILAVLELKGENNFEPRTVYAYKVEQNEYRIITSPLLPTPTSAQFSPAFEQHAFILDSILPNPMEQQSQADGPVLLEKVQHVEHENIINHSFLFNALIALAVSAILMTIGILILTNVIILSFAPVVVGVALTIASIVSAGFFAHRIANMPQTLEADYSDLSFQDEDCIVCIQS